MTSGPRLYMWPPQPWTRHFARTLSAYPWQSYTLSPFWCRVSILNSDWLNHPQRWVMGARCNALIRYMPDSWSHWPRRACAVPDPP